MLKVIILAAVLVLVTAQTPVKSGIPFRGNTPFRSWTYYTIPASEDTTTYVQISAAVDSGIPFFYVGLNSLPTFTSNVFSYENTTATSKIVTYVSNPNVDLSSGNVTKGTLYFGVYGYRETKYTITLTTQGPIVLDDGRVVKTAFPVTRDMGYIFYKFTVEPNLRRFQVVAELGIFTAFYFFVTNSTTQYPLNNGNSQYMSTAMIVNGDWHSCLKIDYPYPGTYRMAVMPNPSNFATTVQYQPNTIGPCDFEPEAMSDPKGSVRLVA